jgi:hypothetical protein
VSHWRLGGRSHEFFLARSLELNVSHWGSSGKSHEFCLTRSLELNVSHWGSRGKSHEFCLARSYLQSGVSLYISHWVSGPTRIETPVPVKVSGVKSDLNRL